MNICVIVPPFRDKTLIDSYLDFQEEIHQSYYSTDAISSREFRRKEILTPLAPHELNIIVLALLTNQVMGRGFLIHWGGEEDTNPERCFIHIEVLPQYSNQGVAKNILSIIKEEAIKLNKRIYETWIRNDIHNNPAISWVKKLNCKKMLVEKKSRLYHEKLETERLQMWKKKLEEKHKNLDILVFPKEDYVPKVLKDEKFAKELVNFYNEVDNLVPRGDSSMRDSILTLNQLRNEIKHSKISKYDRIKIFVQDEDKIVGVSGVYFPHDRHVQQVYTALTGVRKAYQNQGIASLLKLKMLVELMKLNFLYVETENAEDNKYMLKLNHRLGFKEIYELHAFEGKIEDIPY